MYDTHQAGTAISESFTNVENSYYKEIERMAHLPIVTTTLKTHLYNNRVYEEFYNFNNQQRVKSAFHLINADGVFLASTTPSDSSINGYIWRDIIPRMHKDPHGILMETNTMLYPHGKTTTFTMGKPVLENDHIIGYIVFQLYEEDLQHLIFGGSADIAVITDDYERVIATTNGIVKGLMNKFSVNQLSDHRVEMKGQHYYMKEVRIDDRNYRVYTLNSINNSSLIIWIYVLFMVVTSGLLFILVQKLAEKMSSQNVQSIEKLLGAVKQLKQGDLQSYVRIETGDEFEILADQYNDMLDHLNELIQKNEELSNLRRINEIRLLESQFNPHFLFNVLETLRYTMLTDKGKAQEIIFSLSRLLRYSIENTSQNVLFEKDLNYIFDYLKLLKMRFTDRLHYKIEIPEQIKQTYVPKLLLQPLIENAIKYGYRHQTHLTLKIGAVIRGNDIEFTVSDDGSGISEAKLIQIHDKLTYAKTAKQAIGLYNTHRRLVLLYGEPYGVEVMSTKGQGTVVKVRMPFCEGDFSDVQNTDN